MTDDKEATFEEYLKAKKFARWKYKYGLFVLIACWIAIIFLIIYVLMYANELSTNPALYMMKDMNLNECNCNGIDGRYYINRTAVMFFEEVFELPLS